MGHQQLELGGRYLGWLREANEVLGDPEALQARMEEDGYLLLRGLQKPENVLRARRSILENLKANGQLDPSSPLMDGKPGPGAKGAFLGGRKEVTRTPEFLALVDSPEIMNFFEQFLDGPVLTYDYKWLRVVGPDGGTGAHYDIVYMGRGTRNLYTCWTPLGDVPLEAGPLTVLVGSHRFSRVRETYGEMDVDRDKVTGSFSDDPVELVERHGGQWQTAEFKRGDVLVFGMFTMHGSLINESDRFRISADTRYQRADEPVDERWIGENPMAHYAWTQGRTIPMEEMRKKWGV